MRPDTHAALVNLANTIREDDDLEAIVDELRAELLGRYGFDLAGLRDAFTEAARMFWERENQMHSVRVPRLRLVTEPEFRDMAYGPKEAS